MGRCHNNCGISALRQVLPAIHQGGHIKPNLLFSRCNVLQQRECLSVHAQICLLLVDFEQASILSYSVLLQNFIAGF